MGTDTLLTVDEIKQRVQPILGRYGARRAGLFGSAACGQMRRRSDVDILVELPRPVGLFDFVGIKLELEEALGRRVDLVEYDAIKPAIRERVLANEVPIL
ncbi:MAG: nucleotidyltransferase family protein [Chloroflexi bacterium]|nr:nucleotidyltransferase family protein [Chloroflexota bacterium]